MNLGANDILSLFEQESGGPLALRDILRGLALRTSERRELRRLLNQLLADGTIARVGRSRFVLRAPDRAMRGTLIGYGDDVHFHSADGALPVPVPPGYAGRAMHGDEVEAHPLRGEDGPAARVIRVVGNSPRVVLASFRESSGAGYVVPQDPRLPPRIYLEERPRGVKPGDLVLVEILWAPDSQSPPGGRVTRSLAENSGLHRFYHLLEEFSLPLAFPERVIREALDIASAPETTMAAGRIDYRDVLVFTIDPENAYDHDDAVSITPLPGGGARVAIHIADVSTAVAAGSALDREARARGNSVYLEDGVVPMFPEELTRDVLSLVPGKDRYTLSAEVELDADGRPLRFRTGPGIMRSAHRLSYEEAERLLGNDDEAGAESGVGEGGGDLAATLRTMWRVASQLRRRRMARGALDLDVGEAEVQWNDRGEPVELRRRARLRSHRLIEEFMLLANEAVARYVGGHGRPLIYRVHEPPDAESLDELGELLLGMGYRLPAGNPTRSILGILKQSEGHPERDLVTSLVLRSMRKAIYSERNVGHFALALGDYTHFTSPIRRYPDLTVHRALRATWETETQAARNEDQPWDREEGVDRWKESGSRGERRKRVDARELADVAAHATRREILSDQVERASFAQAAALYMRKHVGDEFEGVVSGYGRAGMFIRIVEIPVEGLIPYASLGRERFTAIEGTILLRGDRTGRTFRMGDTVRVRVARSDPEARHIDFELLAHDARRGRAPSSRAHGAHPVTGARRRARRTKGGAGARAPGRTRRTRPGGGSSGGRRSGVYPGRRGRPGTRRRR